MGRATLTTDRMDNWAVSEHMIRCKVDHPDYLPEFVFALLSSMTVGYPLITSFRHGKDVPELDPDELGSIPIPRLTEDFQRKVTRSVKKAFRHVDQANALEDEAQALLVTTLDWDRIPAV
jgi:hypothetical protein